jgi:multidrug efflux pump subunit AcrA (membrane-fusion protein)
MKQLILTLVVLVGLGCAKETETVRVEATPADNSRVVALEQSLLLNFNNDALLAARVSALEAAQANMTQQHVSLHSQIAQLRLEMQTADANQQQVLQTEINNRIVADQNLQAQLTTIQQSVGSQISALNVSVTQYVNQQFTNITNNSGVQQAALDALNISISNLTNRVINLENNGATDQELADLRLYINNNFATIAMFNALSGTVNNLSTQVTNLNNTVTNLTNIVNGQQMTMVKAPCANAKEMFIKVGGKYYAAMNVYGQCEDLDKVYLAELGINITYRTTDGMNCNFKVLSNGTLQAQ